MRRWPLNLIIHLKVAYGVALTLLVHCATTYHDHIRKSRVASFQMAYICVMFVFGSIYLGTTTRTIELAYVLNRNFPGGPTQYDRHIFSEPITVAGLVPFFAANWMSDALLLWRLSVVFRSCRYHTPVLIFPVLLFVISLAMSIVTMVYSTRPNASFWSTNATQFALGYYSLTVAFTILSTGLLITRLLVFRSRFTRHLGRAPLCSVALQSVLTQTSPEKGKQHTQKYVDISAMLIESSSLYTVWSILFLGLYVANNPVQYIFLASINEVQIISPLLILIRVFKGTAWRPCTECTLTSMRFQENCNIRTDLEGTRDEDSERDVIAVHVEVIKQGQGAVSQTQEERIGTKMTCGCETGEKAGSEMEKMVHQGVG
ncbi:hypothetical protein V5O48_007134 [Marasmius crinis-equi]|uniref:Uncharacterized protein n=1 Tax=Marasmius crinis-equi TaxID=585013 RepID=A0ABR3FHL9_9AGAR